MKTLHCDVLVVGGGSAGVAAALAAARAGAKTVLLEQASQLGGMGSQALVHTFCGLYHPMIEDGPQWLNPGIPTEIGEQLLHLTGQQKPDLMGRYYVLRSHPAVWAALALRLVEAEPQLRCLTQASVEQVRRSDAWEVMIQHQGVPCAVQSRALVDCSGDATVARLLSPELCEMTAGQHLYRPAMIAVFPGVPEPLTDERRLELIAHVARAVKSGQVPAAARVATFRSSPCSDEVFVSLDLEAGGDAWDPVREDSLQAAWDAAVGALQALASYLRTTHPLFQAMGECRWPTRLGIRESARWRGDYVLTGDDLIACRRFPDEVALAGWPLEMRETARGPKFRHFERAEPAGIPLRSLQCSALPGLYFAGRCLSADHEALASVRVMGTCLATGQAAGAAAASTTVPVAST